MYLTHEYDLSFSPSDLTAYLACEHLTTLELEVARKEREKPKVENDQADLVKRKGGAGAHPRPTR